MADPVLLASLPDGPVIATWPCAPVPGILNISNVDAVIARYHSFRPTAATPEYKMPSWACVFFMVLEHSGSITFEQLCLRCAVRPDTIIDLHIDRGHFTRFSQSNNMRRLNALRYFVWICNPHERGYKRNESIVYLRSDVAKFVTAEHMAFAMMYNHMHPQTHIETKVVKRTSADMSVEEAHEMVGCATGMSEPPEKKFEFGQAAIAAHAATAEPAAALLKPSEVNALNEPPPLLFNLTVCTNPACTECFPIDFESENEPIGAPVELFEPLDFFLPSWRDAVSDYGAFDWWLLGEQQ